MVNFSLSGNLVIWKHGRFQTLRNIFKLSGNISGGTRLLSLRAPDRLFVVAQTLLSQVVAGLILNVKSIALDDGNEIHLSEVCWADCTVIG